MRISEIASLSWDAIQDSQKSYAVKLRQSKANQDGQRDDDVVLLPRLDSPLCPVRAIQAWRAAAGLAKRGKVFSRLFARRDAEGGVAAEMVAKDTQTGTGLGISTATVSAIIQRAIRSAREAAPPRSPLHDLHPRDFGGHSLRRGMATAMAESGQGIDAIRATLRHKAIATTMRYISGRDARQIDAVKQTMEGLTD